MEKQQIITAIKNLLDRATESQLKVIYNYVLHFLH